MNYKIYKKTKLTKHGIDSYFFIKKKIFYFFNIYVVDNDFESFMITKILPMLICLILSFFCFLFNINYFLLFTIIVTPIYYLFNYLNRIEYSNLYSAESYVKNKLQNKLLKKNIKNKPELQSIFSIKNNMIEKLDNN